MKQIATILSNLFMILNVLFIAWFLISWIDIAVDNVSSNPEHYDWNLFIVMLKYAGHM